MQVQVEVDALAVALLLQVVREDAEVVQGGVPIQFEAELDVDLPLSVSCTQALFVISDPKLGAGESPSSIMLPLSPTTKWRKG